VTGIAGADHIDHTPAFNHLAVFASALYRRSHFHSENLHCSIFRQQQNPDFIPAFQKLHPFEVLPEKCRMVGGPLLNGWSRAVESCRYDNRNKLHLIYTNIGFLQIKIQLFASF
jgi:hypothetical protein